MRQIMLDVEALFADGPDELLAAGAAVEPFF
jgi:hypothetical protein